MDGVILSEKSSPSQPWVYGIADAAKEAHILVTGYSNVAVDNIFLGLRAMGVNALRVRSAGGALVGTNELASVPGTIQYELSRHQKTHLAASLRQQKKLEQARSVSTTLGRNVND